MMKSIPPEGLSEREIESALSEMTSPDLTFGSGRILGSMCSPADTLAEKVFQNNLEKNLGDPGLFPGSREVENEVLSILGGLLGGESSAGAFLSGGTEANIMALWTAKRLAGAAKTQVLVPETAHFSFDKAADLMSLELIRLPVDSSYRMEIDCLKSRLSSETLAVVSVAGTTGLGAVDPIEEISRLTAELGVYHHVDAAFGGFVLPFLSEAGYSAPAFDFSLKGVSSITIDPHKMGRAVIPAGCILYRNEELAKAAQTPVSYLAGGNTRHRSITGTRPGAAALSAWAALAKMGREGFIDQTRSAMELTFWFADEIDKIPGYEIVMKPEINVIGLRHKEVPAKDLAKRLRDRGWALSLFDTYLRVVMMPHVTKPVLKEFIEVLGTL